MAEKTRVFMPTLNEADVALLGQAFDMLLLHSKERLQLTLPVALFFNKLDQGVREIEMFPAGAPGEGTDLGGGEKPEDTTKPAEAA